MCIVLMSQGTGRRPGCNSVDADGDLGGINGDILVAQGLHMSGLIWAGTVTNRGPIFPVEIGVTDARAAVLQAAGEAVPAPVQYDALIDTGASSTVVHQGLLADAIHGPAIVGAVGFDFLGGQHNVTHRAIKMFFQGQGLELHVGEWPLNPTAQNPTRVVIGRDILARGGLLYDGQMNTWKLWIML